MYPYIRCYTCGRPLGHIVDAFRAACAKKVAKAMAGKDLEPIYTQFADADVVVGDILDLFNIRIVCCRTRMITQVDFTEYY